MRMHKNALASAVAAALLGWNCQASASYYLPLNSLFTMLVMEPGETFDDEGVTKSASEVWTGAFNSSTAAAFDYWTSVMGGYLSASHPVVIRFIPIATANRNAAAYSPTVGDGSVYNDYTQLTSALIYDYYGAGGKDYSAYLADIQVNHSWWYQEQYGWIDWDLGTMNSLPSAGVNTELTPMLIHELGHALGLLTTRDMRKVTEDDGSYYYTDFELVYGGLFSQGLYDVYDKPLAATSKIVLYNEVPADGGNYFAVYSMKSMYYDGDGYVSGAYFRGEHTDEVLNGAMIDWPDLEGGLSVPGIPVNGFDPDDNGVYYADFSHLELKNGLMSHQSYRNYTVLMEAELAVMQDLGLKLDRRNHYGYSVYNSGEASYDDDGNLLSFTRRQFVNTNPYYGRADGQWVWGSYNPTAYGVGLHVYGSYNDITQAADLLSSGAYGVGIRVDGAANAITVDEGTRVSADGTGGTGILVAYGKGHEINVNGTVTATGEGGNAVDFNFGDNFLGNGYYVGYPYTDPNTGEAKVYYDRHGEYRGSYIYCDLQPDNETKFDDRMYSGKTPYLLPELEGALVDNFNVSGTLIGAQNAIHMARNAYVKNINFLKGAQMAGDITSEWSYASGLICGGYTFADTAGHALLTTLNFGVDSAGNADPDFSLSYDGDITGQNSFIVNFAGGSTALGLNSVSTVTAMAVQIGEDATLTAAADFNLNGYTDFSSLTDKDGNTYAIASDSEYASVSFGTLSNNGTFAVDGNGGKVQTISISGNYTQSGTGTLAMRFGQSTTDVLDVTGDTTVAGSFVLSAAEDYFATDSEFAVPITSFFSGTDLSALSISDSLAASYSAVNSPTLTESMVSIDGDGDDIVYTLAFTRSTDAYSRFASSDSNAAAIGRSLDTVAADAPSPLRAAIAAMDFSSGDGSDITAALDSMIPAAFNDMANGVLSHQTFLNDIGKEHLQQGMRMAPGTYVYADPYVIRGRRGSGLYAVGKEHDFGVIAGVDKVNADSLYGVYLNLNERSQKTKGRVSVRDRSMYAGVRAVKGLNDDQSFKVFGDARAGFDYIKQDRFVSFYDYYEKLESEYTAYAAALSGGLDYEVKLAEFTVNFDASLAWSYLRTPGITEDGGAGLHLEHGNFNSLKAGAGLSLSLPETKLEAGGMLGFTGTLRYHRELLDKAGSYNAYFKGSDLAMYQTVDHQGKDSLYASLGGRYKYQGMVLGADLGGEFYQGEGREIFGRINLEWQF